jgi:uncharacterized protein (DUF433 family)
MLKQQLTVLVYGVDRENCGRIASEADILRSYPSSKAEDLANAWAYVRSQLTDR